MKDNNHLVLYHLADAVDKQLADASNTTIELRFGRDFATVLVHTIDLLGIEIEAAKLDALGIGIVEETIQ